jgi:hypothetical protein
VCIFAGWLVLGFSADQHQSRQPPDALFVHGMALVLKVPSHMSRNAKRSVHKLPDD